MFLNYKLVNGRNLLKYTLYKIFFISSLEIFIYSFYI